MKFSSPYWFLLSILIIVLVFSIISGSQIRKEGFREGAATKKISNAVTNNPKSKNAGKPDRPPTRKNASKPLAGKMPIPSAGKIPTPPTRKNSPKSSKDKMTNNEDFIE